MKKGEKIVREYYAVTDEEYGYVNNYWGFDNDFTKLRDMDTLMEKDEAVYMLDREGRKLQKVKVTYEVVEEE